MANQTLRWKWVLVVRELIAGGNKHLLERIVYCNETEQILDTLKHEVFMQDKIEQRLKEVEEKYGVKVLFAAEAGSRAWGYASADSDHDVHFIYMHPKEWYLGLRDMRDVIEVKEYKESDNMEMSGWDLRKALRLLHSANPALFEWFQSAFQYRTSEFAEQLRPVLWHYFSSRKGAYHYFHMAKGNFHKYILGKPSVKPKKYLCVLRPTLAALWASTHQTPPPVRLPKLMEDLLPDNLKAPVQTILKAKKDGSNRDIDHIPLVDRFIADTLNLVESALNRMTKTSELSWDELEALFRVTIGL